MTDQNPDKTKSEPAGDSAPKTPNGYGPPDDVGIKSSQVISTGPILPGIGDNIMSGWSLVRIIAIMCFLASLALGAMLAVNGAAEKWSNNLTGAITIQIKASSQMSEAEQISKTRAILEDLEVVASIRVRSKAESAALLEPWLGNRTILNELPLPTLIEVSLEGSAAALRDFSGLRETLEAEVPGAVLDDHRRWNSQIDRVSNALKFLSLGVLSLIVLATSMIIVFATRSGLAANEAIVEVLHLIGAEDNLIAKEFQNHFFWIALWAGLMGIGAAGLTFLALGQASRTEWAQEAIAFLPSLAFQPSFYLFLVLIPLGAVALTTLTARFTVIHTLTKVV